jgi:hypothetical protein
VAVVVTGTAAMPIRIAAAMVSKAVARRRRKRAGEGEVDHPGSPSAVTAIQIRYAVSAATTGWHRLPGKNYNAFSNQ